MFKFFKKKDDKMDAIIQKLSQLNENISYLLAQNAQFLKNYSGTQSSENLANAEMPNFTTKSKEYSSFEKGNMSKPKSFFDSPAEQILEGYLDKICKKYSLGPNFGIRIVPHQPLTNYVEKQR